MQSRRLFLCALAAFASLPAAAQAIRGTAFTPAAFEAAKAAGKPLLVVVHAPWCPTCKVQDPIIMKLVSEAKYSGITIFVIDYDSQKDAMRVVGATRQSTLIAYKGAKETGRLVGDTNPLTIEDLMESAL